ncbi:DUF6364 family protein [Belliella kenyensis]|uniref:DUF6364 family protein n=1 Tax=Belliella kenyensis TaxID=1472724 RepID=A0ABV8EG46_9BACT|nr:DUF6364 family protein [Belliella kenyensis]MCH7400933.1 DUF6364 family protein [Belliella kenyensis]MDN3603932.1 DUF6364 family protein [Belliella kenyensis]
MSTKLTLTIDKSVIEKAKAFAKEHGKSLSQIIENYLKSLPTDREKQEITPNVKKLTGVIKLPKNFDYKKELSDALTEKHLKL